MKLDFSKVKFDEEGSGRVKKKHEVIAKKTILVDGVWVEGDVITPANQLKSPTMRCKGETRIPLRELVGNKRES